MACNCHGAQSPSTKHKAHVSQIGIAAPGRAQSRRLAASIRYTGPMSVTVVGAVSGRSYKFSRHGAVVQVDPRDNAALAKVPHLRQI